MICPNCGKDAGESNFCPTCGEKMLFNYYRDDLQDTKKETIESDNVNLIDKKSLADEDAYYAALKRIDHEKEKEKKKKRKKRFVRFVCFVLIFVLGISLINLISNTVSTAKRRENVNLAMKNGDGYIDAYNDYLDKKNSKTQLAEDSFYWGKKAMKKGWVGFAVPLFEKCITINSEEYSDKIGKTINKYMHKWPNEGNYALMLECSELYEKTGYEFDYSQIPTWIEISGKNGVRNVYLYLLNYAEDHEIKIDDSSYQYCESFGEYYYVENNYDMALDCYNKYKGSKDYTAAKMECYYQIGVREFKEGSESKARDNLEKLYYDEKYYNYKDTNKLMAWLESRIDNSDYYKNITENGLKKVLKDPSSYRRISDDVDTYYLVLNESGKTYVKTYYNVSLQYSATNSFGGRVSDEYEKKYEESFLIYGLNEKEAEKIVDLSKEELIKLLDI